MDFSAFVAQCTKYLLKVCLWLLPKPISAKINFLITTSVQKNSVISSLIPNSYILSVLNVFLVVIQQTKSITHSFVTRKKNSINCLQIIITAWPLNLINQNPQIIERSTTYRNMLQPPYGKTFFRLFQIWFFASYRNLVGISAYVNNLASGYSSQQTNQAKNIVFDTLMRAITLSTVSPSL